MLLFIKYCTCSSMPLGFKEKDILMFPHILHVKTFDPRGSTC
jgi:hypothetical protein